MQKLSERQIKLAPSIVCADLLRLERDVRRLERAGVDMLHFDVMDGHFVPNLTIGPDFALAVRRCTKLPFDIHLMTTDPDAWVPLFCKSGNVTITVQVEAPIHLNRTLSHIRHCGGRPSVALNPATSLQALDYVLPEVTQVLVMTVNPGYSGQTLISGMYEKVRALRNWIDESGLNVEVQVDGGLSVETAPKLVAAGATVLVGGNSSFFRKGVPLRSTVRRIRRAVAEGLRRRTAR
jgi:ribulose-phosphate 3-epimerase